MIETERLYLIRWTNAHFDAIQENDLIKLGTLLDIETPKEWTTFSDMAGAFPFFYDYFKKNGGYWGCFFMIHKADNKLVGTCGFRGAPNELGLTEIGYEVEAPYRQCGLATEAAKGLIDFAFKHDKVKEIRAHTLAFPSPSVSLLKNLGFQFVESISDPDDGEIWRWILYRI